MNSMLQNESESLSYFLLVLMQVMRRKESIRYKEKYIIIGYWSEDKIELAVMISECMIKLAWVSLSTQTPDFGTLCLGGLSMNFPRLLTPLGKHSAKDRYRRRINRTNWVSTPEREPYVSMGAK